ncbi:hypothetical protein [uncultured Methylobacterium sp.]|uniref:hypothetical protein n=1 Tax=uncultured Methylobacterium sp. TaxID=157278 RepID=UPI002596E921|nr:hypothetical protein [uncultured Methylobacterium sp.]
MTNIALQLRRLDVENGDILVLRTPEKPTRETADTWHDQVQQAVREQGLRDVTCIVLDNCTDLSVERPSTAMQHQRPRKLPQSMS